MPDETVDRYVKCREAMRQQETDLNRSGLKREPRNNRSPWSLKQADSKPWRNSAK